MLRNVVVPLDGSKLSDQALDYLRLLAAPQERPVVTLLGVAEGDGSHREIHRAGLERHLNAVSEDLRQSGLRVVTHLEVGDPAERILAWVEFERPDLLLMATHGRSGVLRFLRGSVAERVLRASPVPLLLVNAGETQGRAPSHRPRRILVPLDGSAEAATIVPVVAATARAIGAEVLLVRVGPDALAGVDHVGERMAELPELERTLSLPRARLASEGLTVRTSVHFGDPAAEILSAAEAARADLIAIATHGRSGVSAWWAGSVTESVLHQTRLPLLVVRSNVGQAAA